jgi:adenylate kinase
MSRQVRHLIIFGGQGAGKGTQAKRVGKQFGLVYIGLGDVLRQMAGEDTPVGRRIDQTINQQGRLMPDDLVSEIAAMQIGSLPPSVGFMLDGYPRTVGQAVQLKKILAGQGRLTPKPTFINLKVPKAEVKQRLTKRRRIEKRHDDIGPIIDTRLALYAKETKPVLDKVKGWAKVIDVDGNQPIPQVTEEILTKLGDAKTP